MKTKKSKISTNIVCGIFAVILALSLTGCNNGSTDDDDGNPFVGTWTGTGGTSFTFTSTGWTGSYPGNTGSGTYTRSGTTATLTDSDGDIATATISGSTMTLRIDETTLTLTKTSGSTGGGGKLTVNNLPSGNYTFSVLNYSGKVNNSNEFLAYSGSVNTSTRIGLGTGSSSPVTLYSSSNIFSGSGTYLVQGASSTTGGTRYFSQVSFTNGSATINWNSPTYNSSGL